MVDRIESLTCRRSLVFDVIRKANLRLAVWTDY